MEKENKNGRHVIFRHTDTERNKNTLPGRCLSVFPRKGGCRFLKRKKFTQDLFFSTWSLVLTNVNKCDGTKRINHTFKL